jgi:acetyltransferase-like isoleucine patch superfamily enzyme
VRTTINRLMSRVYWRIQNRRKHTFVASSRVSRRTTVGKYCWIRQGAEVCDNVTIGDYTYVIGPNTYIAEAVIGKFCSIARNVTIGPCDHDYHWVSTHPFISSEFYKFIACEKPWPQKDAPVIGNDVWIGMNSVVLRGIRIGHGAVIAAGSVVTHDVDPYSIVAGVPSRHLKYRFPEHVRNALLEMEWWNWSEDRLKNAIPSFYDMDEFVARHCRKCRAAVHKQPQRVEETSHGEMVVCGEQGKLHGWPANSRDYGAHID